MPNVYDIGVGATSDGLFTIEVKGAQTLITTLRKLAPEAERELKQKIHEAGRKVLEESKGHAGDFAYSGDYAASFSLHELASGVKIRSGDPGAGAIEFANPGAVYLRGPRAGRPIGTPKVAKPKALIRAANDNEPLVLATVQDALARACAQVRGA